MSAMSEGEVLVGFAAAALVCPLTTTRGGHFLGPSLGGDEVHHQEPLRLERALVPW
jgi:hypothetical protein